jgi:hypothetical protein
MRTHLLHLHIRISQRWRRWQEAGDDGQATTEYALVLLGAAVIALLVVAWATSGGGAGKIGRLFDRVIDAVTSRV